MDKKLSFIQQSVNVIFVNFYYRLHLIDTPVTSDVCHITDSVCTFGFRVDYLSVCSVLVFANWTTCILTVPIVLFFFLISLHKIFVSV